MGVFNRQIASYLAAILIFFMAVIAPWMLISMSSGQGHTGCPFMQGQMSVCSMTVFDHIEHWQSAFTSILVQILSFAALVAVLGFSWLLFNRAVWSPPHFSYSSRPTLLQELFARGLLNSKAY